MTRPAVAVIIPCYATPAHFLRAAIASVQAQSDPRWELVISLDAATPESAAVAREAGASDPARIRVIGPEGGKPTGLSATRNRGVAASEAPFLAFLDADDVIVPDKHAQQLALFEQHPTAAMMYGRPSYWWSWMGAEAGDCFDYQPPLGVPDGEVFPPPDLVARQISGHAMVPAPCDILVRRHALEAVRGFNEAFRTLYEDQVFFSRIGMRFPVLPVDALWAYYRQHPASMTRVATAQEGIAARRKFLNWLEAESRECGVYDGEIRSAIKHEHWKIAHPARAWLERKWNRLVGMISPRHGVLPARGTPVPPKPDE
jgi:glycosyltransferase involved in cell wall biosynthesis